MRLSIPQHFSRRIENNPNLVLIAALAVFGATLRLWALSPVFASSDHAMLASFVAHYFPTNPNSFLSANAQPNSWFLLTYQYGFPNVLAGLVSVLFFRLVQLPITELTWNMPYLITGVASIPLTYLLVKRLANPRAALWAAAFIAAMPVHVAMSRTSGAGTYTLVFFFQLLAFYLLLCYLDAPTQGRAWLASAAIAFELLTDLPLFPIVIFWTAFEQARSHSSGWSDAVGKTLTSLLRWPLPLLPVLALVFQFGLPIFFGAAFHALDVGMIGHALATRGRSSGVHLTSFAENAVYVSSLFAFVSILLAGFIGIRMIWAKKISSILWVWGLTFSLPFIFLINRPFVYPFFVLSIAPFLMALAIVIEETISIHPTHLVFLGTRAWHALVLVSLILGSLRIVFGISTFTPLQERLAEGAFFPDSGVKAAGFWILEHTNTSAIIFCDSLEPNVALYYFHRRIRGSYDSTPEATLKLLQLDPKHADFFIVLPENAARLQEVVGYPVYRAAVIAKDGQALYDIFSKRKVQGDMVELDVGLANQAYDRTFGNRQSVFDHRYLQPAKD